MPTVVDAIKRRRRVRAKPLQWMKRVWRRLRHVYYRAQQEFWQYPILVSILLLLASTTAAIAMLLSQASLQNGYWSGVFIEFHGMMLDLLVFGVLLGLFARSIERRREANRQQEIVDDFKKWNSEEGKLRIAGAVRRLNRLGRTNIDFGGLELTDFSFRYYDIKSIRGSTFYDGTWAEMGSRDEVKLERVDFTLLDCRDVVFSKFNPFGDLIPATPCKLIDCRFFSADLRNGVFRGARLEWSAEHPDELGVWHEFDNSPPAFEQTHYPDFGETDLSGASFAEATLKNADFREADLSEVSFAGAHLEHVDFRSTIGIRTCDFSGAQGLDSCMFDDAEISAWAMSESANDRSNRETA